MSKIRGLMEAKGKTMAGLATETGLSLETIRRARGEKIRMCRVETLEAIAKALGVRVVDLFEER